QGDFENELLVVLGYKQSQSRRSLAENPVHDEAMLQPVATLRVQRIDHHRFRRGGQFVLHVVQQSQKVINRTDAGENVRVRTPLDQLLQLRPGTVEDRRN